MIDTTAVAFIITSLLGCWAMGFSVGKSVAYVRAIRNVA